jgi:enoyl-CoA hydratase/carnithine racemase
MYEKLKRICDDLGSRPKIRVTIFRGASDKAFVSGSDIQQFINHQENEAYEVSVNAIFHPLQHLPISTIALIEGLAVGSGLLITTACDFRISTSDALFGIPVATTLGNCPSRSNFSWIASHLGVPMVKRMLLSAELIKASELLNSAYLYQTTSPKQIVSMTDALAVKLPALALITQKESKVFSTPDGERPS